MKNFRQPGRAIDCIAPTGGVKSGDFTIVGLLYGVAATDAKQGEKYALYTGGVWEFPKASGLALTQGEAISVTAGKITAGGTKVGVVVLPNAPADVLCWVRLNDNF